MGKSLVVISQGNVDKGTTAVGGTQRNWLSTCHTLWSNTEANRQIIYQSAGVLSKLLVRVTANTASGTITIRTRKNGANGSMSVAIGAGVTGIFEDTTNTDTVTAGDKFCVQYEAAGTTGTITVSLISAIFDATTNVVSKFSVEGYGVATASTTNYIMIAGDRSGTTSVEASTENTLRKAGTAKKAMLYVSANARTTNTVFTLRKNRAATSIVITAGPGITGFLEDTTHTVSYAVDDEIDWQIVTSTGTETLTFNTLSIEYETTDNSGIITTGSVGSSADLAVVANTTIYAVVGGGEASYAAEADTKLKTRMPMTLSNLTILVGVNTVSAPSTFRLRVNGADGNQFVTIPSNVTGFFTDTTNTDIVDDDDDINYSLVTGATGTSMTIRQLALSTDTTTITPVIGSGGGSQGRSPLYRTRRRQPDIAIAIVRVRIPLEYEVEKLSVQVKGPLLVPQKPLIKYASAVLSVIEHILPLPIKPTPAAQPKIVRVSIPLTYEVTNLQLKAACSYQVDRLFTQEQQHKIVATSINFLLSDLI